jgi:hypothetical protein
MGPRVRGVKGAGERDSSVEGGRRAGWVNVTGEAWMVRAGAATLVLGCWGCWTCCDCCGAEAGGEAVTGLTTGLGSYRSADDGRIGESTGAGGTVTEGGVMVGSADFGCSAICGGGLGADAGSKLNGLLCSFGGGSGESGDIAWSFGSAGMSVGEGVISGVSVSMIFVGGGGAGRAAYLISS